jgi:hypothetical protein
VSAFSLRMELVGLLPAYPPTHEEEPDSLAPPGFVVKWLRSQQAARPGMTEHVLAVECWPSTDLQAQAHYASRDDMVEQALELVRKWKPLNAGVSNYDATPEERQLGGVTTRIATVSVYLTEANC